MRSWPVAMRLLLCSKDRSSKHLVFNAWWILLFQAKFHCSSTHLWMTTFRMKLKGRICPLVLQLTRKWTFGCYRSDQSLEAAWVFQRWEHLNRKPRGSSLNNPCREWNCWKTWVYHFRMEVNWSSVLPTKAEQLACCKDVAREPFTDIEDLLRHFCPRHRCNDRSLWADKESVRR